jgi:DNA polymerase sigma
VVKPNLAKTSFKVLDLMEVSPQNFDEMCAHLSNDAIGLESRVSIDEAKRQIF